MRFLAAVGAVVVALFTLGWVGLLVAVGVPRWALLAGLVFWLTLYLRIKHGRGLGFAREPGDAAFSDFRTKGRD